MYIPKPFAIEDKAAIIEFLQTNTFGQLISIVEGRTFATPLPFLYQSETETLLCHLAKQNPQWQSAEQQELLVTIQGPHDYISPTWYEKSGVPTWNYQMVHVYGTGKLITEPAALANIVDKLSQIYEKSGTEINPDSWDFQYNPAMLNAIVGIEIKVNEIQCKFKLSQNKTAQDKQNVIDALSKNGSKALAKAMKNNDK